MRLSETISMDEIAGGKAYLYGRVLAYIYTQLIYVHGD